MKMNFALNITTEGTPVDVETSALEDNNMSMEQIHELQDSIANTYMEYIETIDKDITKTRVF